MPGGSVHAGRVGSWTARRGPAQRGGRGAPSGARGPHRRHRSGDEAFIDARLRKGRPRDRRPPRRCLPPRRRGSEGEIPGAGQADRRNRHPPPTVRPGRMYDHWRTSSHDPSGTPPCPAAIRCPRGRRSASLRGRHTDRAAPSRRQAGESPAWDDGHRAVRVLQHGVRDPAQCSACVVRAPARVCARPPPRDPRTGTRTPVRRPAGGGGVQPLEARLCSAGSGPPGSRTELLTSEPSGLGVRRVAAADRTGGGWK